MADAPQQINTGNWFIKIGVAIFFDVVKWVLLLIPVAGEIIGELADFVFLATFWLWFKIEGHSYSKSNLVGAAIVGAIPVIGEIIPEWTLSIIMLYVQAKAQKVAAKVPGGQMAEKTLLAQKNNTTQKPQQNQSSGHIQKQTLSADAKSTHSTDIKQNQPTRIVHTSQETQVKPAPPAGKTDEEYSGIKNAPPPNWAESLRKAQNQKIETPSWQKEWMEKSRASQDRMNETSPDSFRTKRRELEFEKAKSNSFGLDEEKTNTPPKRQGAYGVDVMNRKKAA